jgi:nucleotide-binding universal stress UspA family protein
MEQLHDGIVVGHDGSRASSEAVRWAAGVARRLEVPLHVIRAWSFTNAPRPESMSVGYVPPVDEFAEAVRVELERHLAGLDLGECDVRVHPVHAGASAALLESVGEGVEVIVVGSRGAGGFRGLGFGSTADQVVRHAPVPVVVVPVGRTADQS